MDPDTPTAADRPSEPIMPAPGALDRVIANFPNLPPPEDGPGWSDPITFEEIGREEVELRVKQNRARLQARNS